MRAEVSVRTVREGARCKYHMFILDTYLLHTYICLNARHILRTLLQGQTLRGLNPQKNPAKKPATLEEPHKDGQTSTLLSKEIWPQGCEKSDASNMCFESLLASHSSVAKSP